MATFTTFTTLVGDMQTYLERGGSATADPTVFNQIPRLINLGERACCNELKLLGQLEVLVDPAFFQNGVSVLTKPDRWRQTVSMNCGTGTNNNVRRPVLNRGYEYLRALWPDDSQTQDWNDPTVQPFYADYDLLHWLVAPTPTVTLPGEVNAYMQPVLLDAQNQSNFWTEYTPNLLLYSALLEAAPFLKGDERLTTWAQMRQREITNLDSQDLQRMLDRAVVRTKP